MPEGMAKPFSEILRAQFGIKKDTPKVVAKAPVTPPPEPKKPTKTVGDPAIALSAQAIYDPNVPSPANPPGKMVDQGTAPAMEVKSKWDRGNE